MNQRIIEIASFVPKGAIVADIGTDHALLPIYLIEQGICEKVYACDVKDGPLNSARENINKKGFENQIQVIKSDGFIDVPKDINCAVIAGMGCITAIKILEEASDRLPFIHPMIVQVNDDVTELRRYLSSKNYTILDEGIMKERSKYYTIVAFDTTYHEAYTPFELHHGPILYKKKTPTYLAFVDYKIHHLSNILNKITNDPEYKKEIETELNYWQAKSDS